MVIRRKPNWGSEEGVTFIHLLNRLRKTGILANLQLDDPPAAHPASSKQAAREGLLSGFRLIYGHLVDSGLDHSFRAQLNQLRQFGPMGAL